MSLKGYQDYFLFKNPSKWIEETAEKWFRGDGSPRTRATTETMIFDTMKKYNIGLTEAAKLLEKSMTLYKIHVVGGSNSYWNLVEKMINKIDESGTAPDAPPVNSNKNITGSLSDGTINLNKIFSKLEETRPSDLRRVLNKALVAGDFDDPDLKKEAEALHKKLSAGKINSGSNRFNKFGNQQDFVSRPTSDGPDSEGSGGQG